MEKVTCNVMYELTLPIMYREMGYYKHKVGIFEHKKDAELSAKIIKAILEDGNRIINFVDDYNLVERFVPEDANVSYFKNVNECLNKNVHVKMYKKNKSHDAFLRILNKVKQDNDICKE